MLCYNIVLCEIWGTDEAVVTMGQIVSLRENN